jgi:hypothetical protein
LANIELRSIASASWAICQPLQLSCDSSVLLVTDLIKRENTHFLFSYNIPSAYQEKYENQFNKLDCFNNDDIAIKMIAHIMQYLAIYFIPLLSV